MFTEDQLLSISALQHLLFCPRQCALIHLEQQWAENRLTVEGQHLHRRAHERQTERRDGIHIVRGLALRSLYYGIAGQSDVVEFTPLDEPAKAASAAALKARAPSGLAVVSIGHWQVEPIEYKRGKPKQDHSDRVQLAAQALCLEEMLGISIARGSLFYGKRRRRTEVVLDEELRELTLRTIRQLHELIESRRTPSSKREPKCDSCSLLQICLPVVAEKPQSTAVWFERTLGKHLTSAGPSSD